MVSNDVEALGPGEACQALLLTAKARIVAPLTVLRRGADDFLLLTEPSLGDRVASELLRFRFAAKCAIELEEHTVDDRPRRAAGGRDPDAATTACRPTSSSTPTCPTRRRSRTDELERLRILARTPAWGRELDDRVLPAEAGPRGALHQLHEGVLSRARSRSPDCTTEAIRTGACASSSSRATTLPPYDAELTLDGKVVGRITSAVPDAGGVLALAYVRRRCRPTPCSARAPAPSDAATLSLPAPVAQGIERCPAEAEVARSNRAGRTTWEPSAGGTHGSPAGPLLRAPRTT